MEGGAVPYPCVTFLEVGGWSGWEMFGREVGGGGQGDGDWGGCTPLPLLSPVQHAAVVLWAAAPFTLQLSEHLGEEVRVGVDAQHLGAGGVDDG